MQQDLPILSSRTFLEVLGRAVTHFGRQRTVSSGLTFSEWIGWCCTCSAANMMDIRADLAASKLMLITPMIL